MPSVRASLALVAVPLFGMAVACTANEAIDKAIIATWNCTATYPNGESGGATVTIGDGTFQFDAGGPSAAGTWKRSGNSVTITEDSGTIDQLVNLPAGSNRSMAFQIKRGKDDPAASTATFDGKTLRFDYKGERIRCVKQ